MFGLISKKKHEAEVAALTEDRDLWQVKACTTSVEYDRLLAQHVTLKAELANWRAHGQLRDPKTGRLIPKVKGYAS